MSARHRRPARRGRVLVALAAVTLAWALAALITGDRFTPVRLVLHVAALVGVWSAALAAGLLVCRRPVWGGLCAGLAPALVWLSLPGSFGPAPAGAGGAPTIAVLSMSLRGGTPGMAPTADLIRRVGPDLVMLQEVDHIDALLARLAAAPGPGGDAWPYHCRSGRTLLLSRHPVGAPHPANSEMAVLCPVETPLGRIWAGALRMPKARWRGAEAAAQREGYARLLGMLDGLDAPVILAGDFNATPLGTPYRMVARRLENAFAAAGSGLGFTFPTPARPLLGRLGPFLRIDHVFHSGALRAVEAAVLSDHAPTADHYPVSALLVARPSPRPGEEAM